MPPGKEDELLGRKTNYLSVVFPGEERDYRRWTLVLRMSKFPEAASRIGLLSLAKHTGSVSGAVELRRAKEQSMARGMAPDSLLY